MRRLSILFLLLPLAAAAEPVSYEIRLTRAGDKVPLAGIRVRLDDRVAFSDTTGVALFEYLPVPAKMLVVDCPRFERVEREAGGGGKIEIALVPLKRCDVVFECLLEDGEAVPGTRVKLIRKDSLFDVLPLDGVAGFDGKLPFTELPSGAWTVEAAAPGCEPFRTDVVLSDAKSVAKLALKPSAATAKIEGTCAPGATIEAVRASWTDEGLKPLATATCDVTGRFAIAVPAQTRGAAASPHRALLRARKEGYLDTFFAVEYGDLRGPVAIPLALATAVTDEKEPDGDPATATAAPKSGKVRFKIAEKADRDVFALDLTEDGLLHVRIAKCPIGMTAILLDAHGIEKARANAYGGQPIDWPLPVAAGRWSVGFEAWGGQETFGEAIEAVFSLDAAADSHERNEEAATAAAIVPGNETWGSIFPVRDRDAYRVKVDAAGLLRVQIPARPIALTCSVTDGRGQVLAALNAYGNNPLDLMARLPKAGAYTVTVSHWGDTESSVVPYRMRTDFAPAGLEETAADLAIPLDSTASGSINPIKDRDSWKVDIRESGTLSVHVAPRLLGVTVRVLGADGKELAAGNAYGNMACDVVVSLQRPGFHFVEVAHWGDSEDSPLPYVLSTEFHPNDSWDARRNETPATSSRISLARTVTGAIATVGDHDVYRFQVPRRSVLTADLPGYSLGTTLRLTGPSRNEFGATNAYARMPNRLVAQVVEPGMHTISVEAWGNTEWTADRYRLRIHLDPEDPLEPNNSYAAASALPLSRGLSGTILPVGDVDVFRVDLPEKGAFRLVVTANPLGRTARVVDGAGKEVIAVNAYGNQPLDARWENPAPQRVWVKVEQWGNTEASAVPYTVSVTREKDALPPRAKLTVAPGGKPRTAAFTLEAEGDATSFQTDLNGDGAFDISNTAFAHTWQRGGHFAVMSRVAGKSGDGWTFAWVDARDPAEEPDIEVEFVRPGPGEILQANAAVEFDAWGRDGSAVAGAELYLEGELLGRFNRAPFTAELPVAKIAGKTSKLRVVAWSERGWKAEAELPVSAPPLVNLRPEPGARVTSGGALVEWDTAEEGPSEVVVGDKTFKGPAGRHHAVALTGLAAGTDHTWSARTGTLHSEPRVLSCIRGIEFAERRYEAKIERDYDQKGVVRVVNHGDRNASLVLHVVSEQKDLLVGFVGEGSQDMKVSLEPGEYRDVALGLSAQDAMEEKYLFRVTLEGSFGAETHSDAVDFEAAVRMPKVTYDVKVSEPDPGTLARRVEIVNTGDTITDFGASLDDSTHAVLTPAVQHARLEAGRTLTLLVSPHLAPDWKDFDVTVHLRGVHVKKESALQFRLPAGKRIIRATVGSRQDNKADDWVCTNRPDVATGLSVPAGPQIGGPVDILAPPPPPRPEPPPPSDLGSPERICKDIVAMLEKAMKDGTYEADWDLETFWQHLNFIEGEYTAFNPNRRFIGNLHLGKHLDTEDGGTDFYGNAFKPVRTGYEVALYRRLKDFVRKEWIGADGKPKPLDHAQVLDMALRVSRFDNGKSNVPLAILTAHNVIRILARAQQWDGPGMTGDYGHDSSDPMWPVLQDLRGVKSVDDGPTLGNDMVSSGTVRPQLAGKPSSWTLDLFNPKSEKPLFAALPGSDETASLNGGSHYYLWIGMLGRGVLGRLATVLGVVKEQIVKWQMGDGERGGKEGGYANKGQDVVKCVMEALERMKQEKNK